MSQRRPARRSPAAAAGFFGAGVAAVLALIFVLSATLPDDGVAARMDGDDPTGMTAGATSGKGCSPTPTPTPEPTPTPSPVPSPTDAGSSPLAFGTQAMAAVVRDDIGSDASLEGGDLNASPVPGIDISHWDGPVDMHLVRAAGVRFVFTKATQGTTKVDDMYSAHIAAARAEGIAVGSYHFFDYKHSGLKQANHFVDTMAANGALLDTLPPVVDVECLLSLGRADQRDARSRLRTLVDRVYQRTGRKVMIYTSAHMWNQVTGNDLTFGDQPLWVAYWNRKVASPVLPQGWTRWAFWQQGPLKVPGISRKFDGNIARGSRSSVERLRSRRMVVAGDAAVTRAGRVDIELQGLDGDHIRTSTDDTTWGAWTPRAEAGQIRLEGPDGERRVRVQARDARGTRGPVVSDTITVDATAPVAEAPRLSLRTATVGRGKRPLPVRVTWAAKDGTSGIASADMQTVCAGASLLDTGAAGKAEPRSSVRGSSDHWLKSGTRCVSSALVTDEAGNTVAASDRVVHVRAVQDKPSEVVTYSSGWKRSTPTSAFGGSVRSSATVGRWVRFRFTGTHIALVSTLGADRGRVRIAIDGTRVATVDLRSDSHASRRVVFHQRLSPGTHTIEVRVLGTAGRPRHGARVDIDGFIFIGP